ncbi:thioredoxin domain-containing protein [Halonotius terrestris]|uniref:Thioredoxin domain-containing protein n=1 Tax=Halonotius terrestris TaxID=2487750 RepID=A0A8J8PDS7_9EURY|nr:DUF255 domain-containing protein [Halonotius terrestris]TQQ83281.1 thioredoxin domain-containing protein [Halonotius terrestris]
MHDSTAAAAATESTRVEWRAWGPDAFEEAAATDTPILLSLSATWCGECHEMDARTYSEPRIAANITDSFVPIRVDVDRNPRVRERYNMGGFPTTAFLTPTGELLTGATYLGPDSMRSIVDRIRQLWDEKGADAGRVPRAVADEPTPADDLDPRIEEHIAGQLTEQFDPHHGGWGTDAKFPLPRTIEFALKREPGQARQTLDAIAQHLYDPVDGGFFRFATERDWSGVRHEKVLETNAALTRAFANGYLYTGEDAYREPARHTIDYLTNTLWTGVAVGGSQGPGQGASYYSGDADERADQPGPRTDYTVFAGGNALAADALLTYYAYTDDDHAREYAERILDAIESDLIDTDSGVVTHYRTEDAVGETDLLEDAARVVTAWATARQVLGDDDYLTVATSVADNALDTLGGDGAFRDGPAAGDGLCARPLRPIDTGMEFADGLLDLAAITGNERYREAATDAVEAFAGAWDRIGVQVAGYGSVAARLTGGDLAIDVGDPAGSDLHRAALRIADHEAVVIPDADGVEAGTARIRGSDASPATTPEELSRQISEAVESLSN